MKNLVSPAPPAKPKSWKHFSKEGRLARQKQYRLEMRNNAMKFREEIAPDGDIFQVAFSERCRRAAESIRLAIFYRDLARPKAQQ